MATLSVFAAIGCHSPAVGALIYLLVSTMNKSDLGLIPLLKDLLFIFCFISTNSLLKLNTEMLMHRGYAVIFSSCFFTVLINTRQNSHEVRTSKA